MLVVDEASMVDALLFRVGARGAAARRAARARRRCRSAAVGRRRLGARRRDRLGRRVGDPADRDLPPGGGEQDRRVGAPHQPAASCRISTPPPGSTATSTSSRARIPRRRARRSSSSSPSASRRGSGSTRSPRSRCSTPMHRGDLGTAALNRALQERLNPPGRRAELVRGDRAFRRGDKVMQLTQRLRPERVQRRHRRDRRDRHRGRQRCASTSTGAARRTSAASSTSSSTRTRSACTRARARSIRRS